MKKILIVDDDESMRALFRVKLRKHGYEITLAAGGMEGVEILNNRDFDLVSLDQMMPEMNGIETFRKMKAEIENLPPVIMVTGDQTLSVIIEFMRLGGDDYVIKSPDFISDLKLRIEHVLEVRRLLIEKAKQDAELKELRTVRKVAVTFMHEINNPLSMISGANALLTKEFGKIKHNENITKYVERIYASVRKLEKMTGVSTAMYSEKSEIFSLSGAGFQK